jgi:hypothetical protein
MSQTVLPNTINYAESSPSISPSTQNYTQVLQPVNGSTFSQNQQIFIDIPSRRFIDPQSIYIRYRMTIGSTADQIAGFYTVLGCPVYTPFARVETFINFQQVDSIQDFNIAAHAWSNLYLGVNEKYGNQFGFGYNNATDAAMDKLDGRTMPAVPTATPVSYFVSAPLVCTKLTSCEKFIPAFATGGIRLIFTLDTYANMLSTMTAVNTTTTNITNFELVYDLIDFGPEVEQSVLSQPSIMIKSNGYANSSVTVPTGTNGTITLVYNQRFASIRNAIALPSATAVTTTYLNGKFDSIDITTGSTNLVGGYYSLNVGGITFPQGGPISFANNKAGALSELRKATGNLYDWSKSMSINSAEFRYGENQQTTLVQPGKCYIGFDLNKINSASRAMLNGTSSQNAPINLILNFNVATASAKNVYLLLNYDCIFILDPRTKIITFNQ